MNAFANAAGARTGALFCLLIVLSLTTNLAVAQERNPSPPPPESMVGEVHYQPDLDIPYSGKQVKMHELPHLSHINPPSDTKDREQIGGDDVVINGFTYSYGLDFAISSTGVMFCVEEIAEEDNNIGLEVHRSTDGGHTWSLWATFSDPDPQVDYFGPDIIVAEGTEDRVFLAWALQEPGKSTFRAQVAWSPLAETASWTLTDLYSDDYIGNINLATDAGSFSAYYVYAAFRTGYTSGTSGTNIMFTRTTNLGTSWETPYSIATLNLSDRGYWSPQICYGYGGYVHVSWIFHIEAEGYDDAVRYRRVPGFASGGQAAWEPIKGLSPHNDGFTDWPRSIAASASGGQVLVGYDRCWAG